MPDANTDGYRALRWATKQTADSLSCSQKAVLVALAQHADVNGRCWPSLDRLARYACLSTRAVRLALRDLEGKGVVKTARGTGAGHPSLYTLQIEDAPDNQERVSPLDDERGNEVPPSPPGRRKEIPPSPTKRRNLVPKKGAPRSAELPIELPSLALTAPRRERQSRQRRRPRLDDPPDVWLGLVPDACRDDAGILRPAVNGQFLDLAAREVCKAAGLNDPKWRGDWMTVANWLREGITMTGVILPTIRKIAARRGEPPGSLKYFDNAIRQAAG